jgi:O-antigen/teichoic acid export membrane protein
VRSGSEPSCYPAAQIRTAHSADGAVRNRWARRANSLRSTAICSRLMYADQFARLEAGRPRSSRVSIWAYGSVVLLTGSLAIAQFYFLPNNLGPTEFGLTVLGLSVIQAAFQFSDVGSINASLRTDLTDELRVALRMNAVSISSIVCLGGIIVSCGLGFIGATFGYVSAAAFSCALLLVGGKAHASAAVQMGDEKGATRHNLIWQNSPKLGSIIGSFGTTAVKTMLAAVITSALFSRPHVPHTPRWSFVRINRNLWMPGLAVAIGGFLMTWTDTYALSIVSGIDEAGQYQAVVRPLTGITYLYLPIIALIQAADNATAHKRVKLLAVAGIAVGGLGSVAIAVFLVIFGRDFWPDFRFDTKVVVAAAVAATAMCVATIMGIHLVQQGKHIIGFVNSTIGAALLLVLSLLTVGTMGALGAALASAIAWTFIMVSNGLVYFTQCRPTRSV